MKKITLILISFFTLNSCSQTKKERFENAINKFTFQFNESKYDDIYNTLSIDMQKAFPLEKIAPFLQSQKKQKGNIVKVTYYNYKSGWANFKASFEKDSSIIKLALNKDQKISGFQIKPIIKRISLNSDTKMILPFNETWFVFWGGDTPSQNYHAKYKAQKNAFDFLIKDKNGKTYKTGGKTNEDYYAFGKEIIAPTKAKVITVIDGVLDNKPGIMNPNFVSGNAVVLQTKHNEFLFFSHFKNHSIKVKEGDIVNQGDLLGLCGNSGNSSEPHLHFHIQNSINKKTGIGIKSYFESIIVNGEKKHHYSPIKGELIKNK